MPSLIEFRDSQLVVAPFSISGRRCFTFGNIYPEPALLAPLCVDERIAAEIGPPGLGRPRLSTKRQLESSPRF